mmetsp:Transcript_29581/g.82597  ORF Transcript_29581/g.82597 Transcript_29581/m.82597 type:complete len:275 (+) Transcript_29581:128-952(+)
MLLPRRRRRAMRRLLPCSRCARAGRHVPPRAPLRHLDAPLRGQAALPAALRHFRVALLGGAVLEGDARVKAAHVSPLCRGGMRRVLVRVPDIVFAVAFLGCGLALPPRTLEGGAHGRDVAAALGAETTGRERRRSPPEDSRDAESDHRPADTAAEREDPDLQPQGVGGVLPPRVAGGGGRGADETGDGAVLRLRFLHRDERPDTRARLRPHLPLALPRRVLHAGPHLQPMLPVVPRATFGAAEVLGLGCGALQGERGRGRGAVTRRPGGESECA